MSNFTKVFKKFPRIFWVSNIMELFERWAWYGFYMAFALYLTNSTDEGALGFSQVQKGAIMGTGSMLLYLLPIITGAIADKIGYRIVLLISFTMYVTGFFMMSYFESYFVIFIVFIYLAIGGALFKPIIAAMVAKTTDKETSSIGFGIFYMMVNIGGFIGPFIAAIILEISWDYVFYMSIITIGINYFLVFLFFKEPDRKPNKDPLGESILIAFKNIGKTLADWKFVLFLIIMIGFWSAFNQLYYSFPVFVDQWADTSNVIDSISSFWPWLANQISTAEGTMNPVMLSSLDAFFIVLFQLIISTIVMKYRPLNAMMSGIFILSIGVGLMFATQNGWYLVLGLFLFSVGEMASSPKFTEYVGRIAPKDKTALYIGSSYLPIAGGHQIAGYLSGSVYANMSDKITFLKQEVVARGLNIQEISEQFSQNDYINKACELMGLSEHELTNLLWDKYNPDKIWILFTAIAVGTVICLFVYDKFILRKKPPGNKQNA